MTEQFRLLYHQRPPTDGRWKTWILSGGRGAGKTVAGAAVAADIVRAGGNKSILFVGHDRRAVKTNMMYGPYGLMTFLSAEERDGFVENHVLDVGIFKNGTRVYMKSIESLDYLRGLRLDHVWIDDPGRAGRKDTLRHIHGSLEPINGHLVTTFTPGETEFTEAVVDLTRTYPRTTRRVVASTYENPYLRQIFVETLENVYDSKSDIYRRELLGDIPW